MVGFRVQLDPLNLVQTYQVSYSEQLCMNAWVQIMRPKIYPWPLLIFRVQADPLKLMQIHHLWFETLPDLHLFEIGLWVNVCLSVCPKREANRLPMPMEGFRVQLDPWNLVQTHQVGHSKQLCIYAWRHTSFCKKHETNELPMAVDGLRGSWSHGT